MTNARATYRTGRDRVERILDAAHELFITNGYRATSLREIARASGISHPALLKYFPTKHEILTDLVERLDAESGSWWDSNASPDIGARSIVAIARRNESTPGWIELFTSLLGEATSPDHPGHELMLTRYRLGMQQAEEYFATAFDDPHGGREEALRIGAAWNGLQILSLYFPGEIDIPQQLADYETGLIHQGSVKPADTPNPPGAPYDEPSDDSSLTPRVRALRSAARLYAKRGYYETSMQEVATEAGLTKAALANIASTKQALLDLVLTELIDAPLDSQPGAWITAVADRPRWLVAAEVVLMCEATMPSHPAHRFMHGRLAKIRAIPVSDPANADVQSPSTRETTDWFVASALGMVVAWLYEPDDVPLDHILAAEHSR